jgi:hypothetical protein
MLLLDHLAMRNATEGGPEKEGQITMKIHSIIGLLLLSVFVLPAGVIAATTIIDDTRTGDTSYWGGYIPPKAQDVIYPPGLTPNTGWDINRMEVTDTGTKIQVKIIGPWFTGEAVGDKPTPGFVGNLFYNSGDLYLSSSGWHLIKPTGSPHYPEDTFTKWEGWDYVVSVRAPHMIAPGVAYGYESGVYALDFDSINWSQGYPGALGRSDQAYYGGYGDKVANATVTFNATLGADSYILYEFDKFVSGDIGLHWTMYCANDVIEGQATLVPEPGSLLFLGLGLLGLCVCCRRRSAVRIRI